MGKGPRGLGRSIPARLMSCPDCGVERWFECVRYIESDQVFEYICDECGIEHRVDEAPYPPLPIVEGYAEDRREDYERGAV